VDLVGELQNNCPIGEPIMSEQAQKDLLIRKYHKSHLKDKEIVISINKTIDSSMDLRNKKELIYKFIDFLTPETNVNDDWQSFVDESKVEELNRIITEEKLNKLFHINEIEAYFVICPKSCIHYKILKDNDTFHNSNDILSDQEIELISYLSFRKYPKKLIRVVFYAESLNRTFIYLTNNFDVTAEQFFLLYKYRWQVELFFNIC
jgi:hypothetical protein